MPRVTFSNELNDFVKAFHVGSEVVQNAQELKLKQKMADDKARYYNRDRSGADPNANAAGDAAYNAPPYLQQSAVPTTQPSAPKSGFGDQHKTLMKVLIDRGVKPEVAAGAVGSLMGESGTLLDPASYNPKDVNGPSGGVASWHDVEGKPGRFTGLLNYANVPRGMAVRDGKLTIPFEKQVGYLGHELDTTYKNVLDALRKGRTVEDGASIWTRQFEVPANADEQVAKRTPYGRSLWTWWGGTPQPVQEAGAVPMQGAACGGMIKRYAEGGFVDDDSDAGLEPDNDADDMAVPVSARPSPVAAPRPEATSESNLFDALPQVIRAGLTGLQDMLGLRASAAPGADHQTIEGARALYTGAGAPPPEQVAQIDQKIDPEGRLDAGMRNVARISAIYQFYVDKGDMKRAQLSAGQLLQASFLQTQKLGALALTALQDGQPGPATQALIAAYNAIPNGKQASINGDHVVVTDQKTGKPVEQFKLTPQILLQAATGLTDGSAYYNQLMAVASGKPSAPVEEDDPAFDDYVSGRPTAVPAQGAPAQPQEQPATVPAQGAPAQPPAEGQAVPTEGTGFVPKTPRPQLPPEPQPGDFAHMNKAHRTAAQADYNAKRHQWELERSRALTEYDRSVAEERKGHDEEQRTIRSRDLDTRKPHPFDLKNPENLTAVDEALGWTEKAPPSDPTVRDGIRSLVGNIASYNPGIALQGATTALAVMMHVPQDEKDQPFKMEKGDDAYGTVRIKFKDTRIPPVYLPKSELDVLVAMRGLVAQRLAAQSAKAAKQEKANSDLYSR